MSERFRHALVTGGAGFIGSHLVRRLLERGIEVTVIDDLSVGLRSNVPDAARLVEGDILDASAIDRAMDGCDVVFHLAARVAIRASFEFIVQDTMTNVAGTASVLRAAAASGRVERFVSTSSMAVYAESDRPVPVPETHPTNPTSPYGVSKLAAEQLLHVTCAEAEIESACCRLFNTFGPGQALSPYVGVVTIFVNRLLDGKRPAIYGDGEQCRDFTHVSDAARGFLCAMDGTVSGETFNIGSGVGTTVNQVLAAISEEMKIPCDPEHLDAVPGELRYSIADVSKAGAMLGYTPRHHFDGAIGEVVAEIIAAR